jgi:hypothetical protein
MGGIVASNACVQAQIDYLKNTWLNVSNANIRLFSNNFTPDPSKVLADFTEATYTGYAAQVLTTAFASSFKVIDGKYQSDSATFTFTCTSGSSQTIYGWYITVNPSGTTTVRLSGLFPAPITMAPSASFTLQVSLQEWALSII